MLKFTHTQGERRYLSEGTSQMRTLPDITISIPEAIYMMIISIDIPLNCSTGPQTIAKQNQLDDYMADRYTV